ncbi:hypothetical protein G6F57_021640 [Rhizopus arrhizus]|nr:hypothetical protein G6F57_021640 [Rhizopus arrhizus]
MASKAGAKPLSLNGKLLMLVSRVERDRSGHDAIAASATAGLIASGPMMGAISPTSSVGEMGKKGIVRPAPPRGAGRSESGVTPTPARARCRPRWRASRSLPSSLRPGCGAPSRPRCSPRPCRCRLHSATIPAGTTGTRSAPSRRRQSRRCAARRLP